MPCVPSFFSFRGRSRGRKTGSLEPNLATVFLFLDTTSSHKKLKNALLLRFCLGFYADTHTLIVMGTIVHVPYKYAYTIYIY